MLPRFRHNVNVRGPVIVHLTDHRKINDNDAPPRAAAPHRRTPWECSTAR